MSLDTKGSALNKAKWALVVILIALAVIGNLYFSTYATAIRVAAIIVVAIVVVLLALTTPQGKRGLGFLQDARMELRKVVWPTRQETVQTTGVVIVIVIITALVLWGIDGIFALIVKSIVM